MTWFVMNAIERKPVTHRFSCDSMIATNCIRLAMNAAQHAANIDMFPYHSANFWLMGSVWFLGLGRFRWGERLRWDHWEVPLPRIPPAEIQPWNTSQNADTHTRAHLCGRKHEFSQISFLSASLWEHSTIQVIWRAREPPDVRSFVMLAPMIFPHQRRQQDEQVGSMRCSSGWPDERG